MRPRLLFITNIPSPYQVDFFSELARHDECVIRVLFCAASERDRSFSVPQTFDFDATVLRSRRFAGTPKDWHWVPRISRLLNSEARPDVMVLSGSYFMPPVLAARRWATRRAIPWHYWGENPRKKQAGGWRQRTKESWLRRFLGSAAGVFGVGSLACDAYRSLLPASRPVLNLPYAPDLDPLFDPDPEVLALAQEMRNSWRVEDPIVVLFSGGLTERKAPGDLLAAFGRIAADHPRLRLLFAGEGPLRPVLEAIALRDGLRDRVRFLGFVERQALRAAYLSANMFVLPTRTHEGWGVVVQEAMAAGLPVILSDRVGSRADLLPHSEPTGWVFPAGDVDALVAILSRLACHDDLRQATGQSAARLVSEWTARAAAERLIGHIQNQHARFPEVHVAATCI